MRLITSFLISVVVGTTTALVGQQLGWNIFEVLFAAMVGGAIQGVVTALYFPDSAYTPIPVKKDDDDQRQS